MTLNEWGVDTLVTMPFIVLAGCVGWLLRGRRVNQRAVDAILVRETHLGPELLQDALKHAGSTRTPETGVESASDVDKWQERGSGGHR